MVIEVKENGMKIQTNSSVTNVGAQAVAVVQGE
jgi:hypothetical protein